MLTTELDEGIQWVSNTNLALIFDPAAGTNATIGVLIGDRLRHCDRRSVTLLGRTGPGRGGILNDA